MSGLTDEERELKRLAEAATPGPWQVDGALSVMGDVKPETWEEVCITGDFMGSDGGEKKAQNEANARHIAAANPATVLRLLAHIETLAKAVKDWGDYADERDRQWREATGKDES